MVLAYSVPRGTGSGSSRSLKRTCLGATGGEGDFVRAHGFAIGEVDGDADVGLGVVGVEDAGRLVAQHLRLRPVTALRDVPLCDRPVALAEILHRCALLPTAAAFKHVIRAAPLALPRPPRRFPAEGRKRSTRSGERSRS